jgi:hypothetical protein
MAQSKILESLTLAALALPMMQTATAGRVDESYHSDFQYGHYSESSNRMSVDIFEGALAAPIGKALTASVNVVKDVISGASPKYNVRNAQGRIEQVVSGASQNALSSVCKSSICDERTAITPTLTYFFDNASASLSGGYSTENDYESRYASTNLSWDINKKLTTLNFGASVAFDELNPTRLFSPVARNSDCGVLCTKTTQQYLLGISQIIDKHSLIQSNMTFAYHNGYLSDPYKQTVFQNAIAPYSFTGLGNDNRPREHFQWAWLTQYVRHFEKLNNSALHVDYRYGRDDWNIESHTMELSWHQPIMAGWQVIPRFRYYSQDAASFYQAVFSGSMSDYNFYSSDYRLAGFGAMSAGLKLTKEFSELKPLNTLKLQAGVEYYEHKAEYQLGGNNMGSFSDFSYYLVTASIQMAF